MVAYGKCKCGLTPGAATEKAQVPAFVFTR